NLLVETLTMTDNGTSVSLTPNGANAPFYVNASTTNGGSVNTQTLARSSSADFFDTVPSGLNSADGSHLRLTTRISVDGLGRTTKFTDSNGNLTYFVYNDAEHAVRTYPGFDGTNTTGPIQISREDRAGSFDEQLTIAVAP